MEALNKLLEKVKNLKLTKSITINNSRDNIEVTYLFFANDLLIFCNLSCVLFCFQVVSRLEINYDKSKLVAIESRNKGSYLARFFSYVEKKLPIQYLGFPLGIIFKNRNELVPVINLADKSLCN